MKEIAREIIGQIEKDVEIPAHGRMKYPFQKMKVNDSFKLQVKNGDNKKVRQCVASAASNWAKRFGSGRKFATRDMGNEIRVWRVA